MNSARLLAACVLVLALLGAAVTARPHHSGPHRDSPEELAHIAADLSQALNDVLAAMEADLPRRSKRMVHMSMGRSHYSPRSYRSRRFGRRRLRYRAQRGSRASGISDH